MRAFAAATTLLLLVACGPAGDDVEDATADHDDGETTMDGSDTSGVQVSGGSDDKPEIAVPDASPPAGLTTEDIVTGDGEEAEAGATVTTHYVGVSWSTGAQFDSSWDRGEPISFSLAQVIPGWQEGIPGMRVGGRRLLVIPPEMAYGDNPPPGSGIEPGETLVFVVDLVEVG